MKKMIVCLILLLLAGSAFAEGGYVLDETAVISGMGRSWQQGYQPQDADGTLTICLPVRAESSNGKLTAELVMDDPAISPLKKQKLRQDFWRDDGLFSVKLKFKLLSDYENGDYDCTVILTGKDKDGNEQSSAFPMTLRLRNGKDSREKAQLEIDGVSADLRVGEDCIITGRIKNPRQYAILENITLTVTDASGDVMPKSSNLVPLGNLMPGESREIQVPMTVLAGASVKLHQLKFDFAYQALGKDASWTETFSLPVTQEIRLEPGSVDMAGNILQGNLATVSLPLMNMGRGEIRNAMVTLEIPEVAARRSVLVGNIESGATQTARLTFTPSKDVLGEYSGTITVTAEDEWSNPVSFTLPVSTTVDKAPEIVETSAELAQPGRQQPKWLIPALGGACGVMLIALILQGALLGKKIRKLEEDRL